jgi:hypothetical protein
MTQTTLDKAQELAQLALVDYEDLYGNVLTKHDRKLSLFFYPFDAFDFISILDDGVWEFCYVELSDTYKVTELGKVADLTLYLNPLNTGLSDEKIVRAIDELEDVLPGFKFIMGDHPLGLSDDSGKPMPSVSWVMEHPLVLEAINNVISTYQDLKYYE